MITHIIQGLFILLGVFLLGHFLNLLFRFLLRRAHAPKSVHLIVTNVVWIILIWIGILGILNALGLKQAVNLGEIGILAISFLIQGVAQSILQGFIILTEHDFDVGDTLDIGGTTGIVTDIGLRIVYLKNDQGQVITVPTSNIYSSTVIKGQPQTSTPTTTPLLPPPDSPQESSDDRPKSILRVARAIFTR